MAFINKGEKQIELQDITYSDIERSYNFSNGNAHINRLALPDPASKMDVFTGSLKHGTIIGGAVDWVSDRFTLPNSGSTDRKDIEAKIRKESEGMNIPIEILGDIADDVYSVDNVVFALQDAHSELQWKQDVSSLGLTGTAIEMGVTNSFVFIILIVMLAFKTLTKQKLNSHKQDDDIVDLKKGKDGKYKEKKRN